MKLKTGKKTGLKYFTYEHIKSWDPCYDPVKYISKDFKGTAIDILKMNQIPPQDRLWCVLRSEIVSEQAMRLFAVWVYRQTLVFLPNQDPRNIEAANVAERYANGQASKEELIAAHAAANAASYAAAAYHTAASAANARDNQVNKLIEMILIEGKERINNRRKK